MPRPHRVQTRPENLRLLRSAYRQPAARPNGYCPVTERHRKTIVAYLIAAGIVLAAVAVVAALHHWPQPVLGILSVCAGVYLYHLLAQAVRASLP